MIQNNLNPFWGYTIKSINIDFKLHQITVTAFDGSKNDTILCFNEVAGHYFDYFAYRDDKSSISEWEVIELAEVYYLPELKNNKLHNFLSNTIDFNFLIEIYASRLFIKANHLSINGESIL